MTTHRATARLAVLTTLVVVLGATAGPAFAQYPPGAPPGAVSDATLVPGQPLTVSSTGWAPGSTVAIDFLSDPVRIGAAVPDATGAFAVEVDVPEGATPGPHTVRLSGTAIDGEPRVSDLSVTVVGDGDGDGGGGDDQGGGPDGSDDGGLALTGADLTIGVTLVTLLALAGALTLAIGRRRSRPAR